VPEPEAITLLAAGILALVGFARSHARRAAGRQEEMLAVRI
jgi:predicted transporter